MKVLLSWLKDYVDINISPKELEKRLFSVGFEVEGVEYLGKDIENIFVGEVTSIKKYEGTHLYICHVNCGEGREDNLILTGATNVFKGAKVPTCLVGAKLPGGMEITSRKMQDMVSYGMLCSGAELGLPAGWHPNGEVNGIMILDEDAVVGEDIKTHLQLDDYLFDISITANRPDCQSIIGIAREVAAFLNTEFKNPDMSYSEDGMTDDAVSVSVVDQDICPRYIAHYVYDVKQVETPLWMKRRLLAVGHNTISALVDITNYVLVEIGQPMHAFDMDNLSEKSIIVRRAEDGETIVTLDEKKHSLNRNNLLIADAEKGSCLAGVMGCLGSGISETTTKVLFESAKFLKDNVRKTSRSLGIQSDAASRFEKGIDEYTVECGMARALNLTQTLGLGKISSTHFDVSAKNSVSEKTIKMLVSQVNGVLGIEVPEAEIVRILRSLSFSVELDNGVLTIKVPRYREDIDTYQDIAEEVIREYGYDKVVPTFLKNALVTNGGLNAQQQKEIEVKNFLCTQGFYEIQTLALTDRTEFDLFMLEEDAQERQVVEILNPLTQNLNIMRTMLSPGILRSIENNLKKGNNQLRFFELANVYRPKSLPLTEPPFEIKTLCLGTSGVGEDFNSMKQAIEKLAVAYDLEFEYERGSASYLHPGRCADILCNNAKIGKFGQLKYEIVNELSIAEGKKSDVKIFLAEINYDLLYSMFKKCIAYKEESKYRKEERDISLLVDKSLECGTIIKAIKSVSDIISSVELFDIYEGEHLEAGKKSMAFKVCLASAEFDITEQIVNDVITDILEKLDKVFGIKMRT